MFRAALSYQASFFGAFESIRPSPETIPPLLKAFSADGFLPNTFVEVGPRGTENRIRLAPSSNEWFLDLDQDRIQAIKNPVKAGAKNMGDPEQFAEDAHRLVGTVLDLHPRKGKRLSLVTKHLLDDVDGCSAGDLLRRFANPLPFYSEANPVAWQVRMTARVGTDIGEAKDTLNVITWVSRESGRFVMDGNVEEFDGLTLHFDINTYQGSSNERFTLDDFKQFLATALETRATLCDQVREILYG